MLPVYGKNRRPRADNYVHSVVAQFDNKMRSCPQIALLASKLFASAANTWPENYNSSRKNFSDVLWHMLEKPESLGSPASSFFANPLNKEQQAGLDGCDQQVNATSIQKSSSFLSAVDLPLEDDKWVSRKELLAYENLLRRLGALPPEVQGLILKFTRGFPQWLVCQTFCDSNAIEHYATFTLSKLKLQPDGLKASERLMRFVFKELMSNSNKGEAEVILKAYRTDAAVYNVRADVDLKTEKFISALGLSCLALALPAGVYSMYCTLFGIKSLQRYAQINYQPIVINKIINYTPVPIIKMSNAILENSLTIIVGMTLLKSLDFSNYPLLESGVKVISAVYNVPYKILEKVYEIPWKLTNKAFSWTLMIVKKISNLAFDKRKVLEKARTDREQELAEALWVQRLIGKTD